MFFGGQRETRTLTVLLPQDFESCASTSSAIRPCSILVNVYAISYQLLHKRLNEYLFLCLHAPVLLQYTIYKESNYLMNLIVEVQNSETTKVSNHCVFVIQLESSSFNDCSTWQGHSTTTFSRRFAPCLGSAGQLYSSRSLLRSFAGLQLKGGSI